MTETENKEIEGIEVAIFEVEFSQQELEAFSELCKHLDKDFPTVVRMCMNERCEDLLDNFKNNVPTEDTNTKT